jgi:hypothetical protein
LQSKRTRGFVRFHSSNFAKVRPVSQNASSKLVARLSKMETMSAEPIVITSKVEIADVVPTDDEALISEAPLVENLDQPPTRPVEEAAHEESPTAASAKMPSPIRWALWASLLWLAVIIGGVVALIRARTALFVDATTIAAYAAGIFTPLTAIWLMALALLRGGVLRDETERARVSVERFLMPVDAAQQRARTMVSDLEAQIARLEIAGETATSRAVALRDVQTDNALSLANAASEVDGARGRVDAQMSTLRELLGTLQGVTGRLESILPDASKRLASAGEVAVQHALQIQQASTRLNDSATSLRQTTEGFDPVVALAVAKLEAAGDQASERMTLLEIQASAASNALDAAAEKATVALDGSRAWVNEHITTIEQSVARVESDIIRRLETLTLSLGETTAQLDKDLPSLVSNLQTQMADVDKQMVGRVDAIRTAWSTLIADWDSASLSAGVRLIDAMARARNIASEAVSTARTATDGIVAAVENTMRQTSEKTQSTFGNTLQEMRAQAAHIEALALQASHHRAEMSRALENQVHVDLAKLSEQLIDRLNAYAVDISRIFSGDVTEQELTNYTRGDRNLFARRFSKSLVGIGTNKVHAKIAERISDEPEFADMVSRFVIGFESLLKLSEQSHEKSSLTVALLTSDLGKMYLTLARSVGRFDA